MAKTVTKKKTTAVAKTGGGAGLPSHLANVKMTGAGVPTDQKDFLIPMARVLDPKSQEVEKRSANYVKGAEPGDIYIKNAPNPVIKGEEGFIFQPCFRDEAVIEWLPRTKGGGGGQGFVARHPANFIAEGKDVVQKPHPEDPKKKIWVRKSTGNLLVETRYYGGFVIQEDAPPMPLVIPFASTGHTVAKQWNMLIASKIFDGIKADLWAIYYKITTRLVQRGDQSWFLPQITDAGEPDEETQLPTTMWVPSVADYERGKALADSMTAGTKSFDVSETQVDDDDTEGKM